MYYGNTHYNYWPATCPIAHIYRSIYCLLPINQPYPDQTMFWPLHFSSLKYTFENFSLLNKEKLMLNTFVVRYAHIDHIKILGVFFCLLLYNFVKYCGTTTGGEIKQYFLPRRDVTSGTRIRALHTGFLASVTPKI